jgi:chromosome segregation ATPase
MRNLDQSLSNKGILDESFSNYTGSDVVSLRDRISSAQYDLTREEANLAQAKAMNSPSKVSFVKGRIASIQATISSLQNELSKIPKSIVDAVDKIGASSAQLALEEKNKQQAAELLALENKNKEIQEAIDKAKGVTGILDDKLNGNIKPLPSDSALIMKTEESSIFSAKNIIIAVSVVGLLIGGYFTIKHFKK